MNETMREICERYFWFKLNKKIIFLVRPNKPGMTATSFSQYVVLVNSIGNPKAPDNQFIQKYISK